MRRNKALLTVGGTPMIQRVARTLQSVFRRVVVISDQTLDYGFLNLPVIPDIHKEIGPLGGIHSALTTLNVPAVFVLGCDTPFVSEELVRYVLRYPTTTMVKIPIQGERLHPLCGIYTRACLPDLNACITGGTRKVLTFLQKVEATTVPLPRPLFPAYLLQNINDPKTLEAAQSQKL
jgi:molybdopterin-guanine dinucleotide biosynthesis protein A